MKKIFFLFLIFTSISLKGISQQVTDNDIVKSILGQEYFNVNHILDSLGVWYHMHLPEVIKPNEKVYSISNSKGSVKLYILKHTFGNLNNEDGKIIEEITINFRHDSREQIEDIKNMLDVSVYHVGKYSTDIVYRLKK